MTDTTDLPKATDLPETLTVTLTRPILDPVLGEDGKPTGAETAVTCLQLREPTGGEMRKTDDLRDSIPITIRVLSLVANVSEKAIRQMKARELDQAGSYLARFVVAPVRKWTLADIPDDIEIPIGFEVKAPAGPITSLRLREPDVGQIEQYETREGWDRKIFMLATVAALPEAVIEQLPVRVINAGEAYLDGFFSAAPKAGATS